MASSLISARGSAALLAGIGLSREQARRVLASGLAGHAVRTAGALLYEERAVRDLIGWPVTEERRVDEACPTGMFVGRLGRSRPIDVTAPWEERANIAGRAWHLSVWTVVLVQARMIGGTGGWFPFVGTVGGFVAVGGDIVGLEPDRSHHERNERREKRVRLVLAQPGPWFAAFEGHRHPTGPGRDGFVHGWQPYARRG